MKKTLALCTPIPEKKMEFIREHCDVTICGELKHGKGNVTEDMTREECMGHELVVLGDVPPALTLGELVDGLRDLRRVVSEGLVQRVLDRVLDRVVHLVVEHQATHRDLP